MIGKEIKNKQNKQGISLIVLVITIVVIIILATAVIVSFTTNNPIESANEAKFKSDIDAFKTELNLYKADKFIEYVGNYDQTLLNADKTSLEEKGQVQSGKTMIDAIPSMKNTRYTEILQVVEGELVYTGKDDKEKKWFGNSGTVTPPTENVGEGTTNESESAWNKPYVPPEFTHKEGTVDEGYVIIDKTNGNEFVWVPVKSEAEYKRGVTGKPFTPGTPTDGIYEDDTDPINIAIKASVLKHGGFYIGRYETGLNEEATLNYSLTTGTYWENATPVIKKDVRPWDYISQAKAIEVAKNMYTGTTKSALINSYIWDTTLNWIISSGAKTQDEVNIDSTTWGNYQNAAFTFDNSAKYSTNDIEYLTDNKNRPAGKWWRLTTGATIRNSAKNIYDMAGNLSEWTTEVYAANHIAVRGGNFRDDGTDGCSKRPGYFITSIFVGTGGRSVLYW